MSQNDIRKSMQWYTTIVRNIHNTKKIEESGFGKITKIPSIGSLHFFYYDPKYKEKLPYYDIFPMSLIFDIGSHDMMGLNLHYLPVPVRIAMFDKLKKISGSKIDENSKIVASYSMLKGISRLKPLQVCLKKYLYSHVESRFLEISPLFWDTAIKLPVQQFRKGSPF